MTEHKLKLLIKALKRLAMMAYRLLEKVEKEEEV